MSAHSDMQRRAQHLRSWMWRDFAIIALGFWLLMAPPTMGYADDSPAMALSDLLTGAAVVILGILVLQPRFDMARWAICLAGAWLLLAPLVFWTPSAAAYASDSLVGALLIALSVLIPTIPGRLRSEDGGPHVPPGWSYNPSRWLQRGPIIAMALLGFFLSRYLAAYQLKHTDHAWDPFFGDGTRRVLESDVSKAWPVSDAGLGAVSYMAEALSGFIGGRDRWRTMPWVVAVFGILVAPLGVVSIMLVILQPVAVGAWCAICLITAAAMLIMISPAIDEIVAMVQFLVAARCEGRPFWKTFWAGGPAVVAGGDQAQDSGQSQRSPWARLIAALDLNNPPWNVAICAAIGLWVMVAPDILGAEGVAANSGRLTGALAVTLSVIAFGEIARPARLINIPLGLWLILSPWVFGGDSDLSRWSDVASGALLVAFAFRRGRIDERFGPWNRYLV